MGLSRRLRWLAALAALSLVLAACGGDGDDGGGDGDDGGETDAGEEESAEAQAGGEFVQYLSEPEHLVPTDSTETQGGQVIRTLFTGLVNSDPETQETLYNGAAESIEPNEDQTVWTITLNDGFTFHNGDPVTAQDYVSAWNFGAYGPNEQGASYFFSRIEGFEEAQEGEAEELSGLEVIDDLTFEVTLDEPFSIFEMTMAYSAYYPLPEEAFDDIDAFEQAPIGNGPYMMDGEWVHDQEIRVQRYEDYGGENPGNADAIEFRIYAEIETAWNDLLAGNIDYMNPIPPEQIATAADELGDQFEIVPSSQFSYLGFPLYQEEFEDVRVRQAFSMAIDRQAIIDAIFDGLYTPAKSVVAPVVFGAQEDPCGEPCEFDPEGAAELLEEAGGWDGPLTLWFNAGAGHEDWMEAVSNQIRENLGIEEINFESLQFAEYLPLLEGGVTGEGDGATGPFRLGWVMDYPSAENYITPLYGTGGSGNRTGYSNPEVDDLITQGNAAGSPEEAAELYAQAEDLVMADLPSVPLWYHELATARSENIDNVITDPSTFLDTAAVEVVNP